MHITSRRPTSHLSTSEPNDRFAAGATRPRRVLILSADVGEGHAAAARALREQLEGCGEPVEVTLIDGLAAMGGLMRSVVEDGYRTQLRVAPKSYSLYYWLLAHVPPIRALTKLLLTRFGARPLRRAIAQHDPDVVVSTYPVITVVLAYMRRRRMLGVPAIATITDMTVFFWAQRGIDTHLVMYEASVADVERIAGRGSVQVVSPLIAAEFLEPRDPATAREALGLPRDGRLVVVSGGGWGVGDLAGAVAELERVPDTTVVCVAGRNEAARAELAARFAASANVRVLGFTNRMADLLAGADVLVHSTGGVTCLEAMASGCPVVSYGLPVGHAKLNTREMARHELLALAHSAAELVEHVVERAASDLSQRLAIGIRNNGPAAADVVMRARSRVRPVARWRTIAVRVATSVVISLGAGIWVMSTDELDALASDLSHPVKTVPAGGIDAVRVVVDAPQREVLRLARELHRDDIKASFAFASVPSARTVRALRRFGDDVIPAINGAGGLQWFHVPAELRREAHALHLHHRFYYLNPAKPTFGELILGPVSGAKGVTGAVQVGSRAPTLSRPLRSGDVVVLRLDRGADSRGAVDWLCSVARESGLSGLALPSELN